MTGREAVERVRPQLSLGVRGGGLSRPTVLLMRDLAADIDDPDERRAFRIWLFGALRTVASAGFGARMVAGEPAREAQVSTTIEHERGGGARHDPGRMQSG